VDLCDFIIEHENDDLSSLVLHRDRWPGIDVALAAECISARRKLRFKVSEWYADPAIICPLSLSAEQCSSTATAAYKAAVVRGAVRSAAATHEARSKNFRAQHPWPRRDNPDGDIRIADLTGGLGVDCWQFSKVASAVLYNEMNPPLFEAAQANLSRLGCGNVEFSKVCISPSTLPGLLDAFRPDLVFADPARRSGGRKVFLPEDCSPDILALQDIILDRGCRLLVKLSPMADISLMLRKFHNVKELHIVEADGECKELLLLMEPGFDGECTLVVGNAGRSVPPGSIGDIRFTLGEEKAAEPAFISREPEPGQILFEPGAALSKSGAFNLISARFGLEKLGKDAHLYCGSQLSADSAISGALAPFGKFYEILETAPFGNQSIRDFAARWPGADVTARALPINSDALRQKLALGKKKSQTATPSNGHIFAVGTSVGRLLMACRKLGS
jgi:hypothetical protein